MSFSMHFRPRASYHYVLTALIGMDGELYWFTWDLCRTLNMHDPEHASKSMLHSVQVKHIAGSLMNATPAFMEKYVVNNSLFLDYLNVWPDEDINAFARKISDPATRIRVLLEKDPDSLEIPTQLQICDDGPDIFASWFHFFKSSTMSTLYSAPLPNVRTLLNLLNDEEDEIPTSLTLEFKGKNIIYKLSKE